MLVESKLNFKRMVLSRINELEGMLNITGKICMFNFQGIQNQIKTPFVDLVMTKIIKKGQNYKFESFYSYIFVMSKCLLTSNS